MTILEALYAGKTDEAEALAREKHELDVFEAAALGRVDRLGELLGDNPELARAWTDDGFTALHYAAFFDGPDAARILLEHGADPSVQATHPQLKVFPIHSAAASEQRETVRLLLEHGADPNVRQEGGFTAFHSAAVHGDRELAELLLAHGGNPAAAKEDGRTPADLAREHGHAELAEWLENPPAG